MNDLLKHCKQIFFKFSILLFLIIPMIHSCKCDRDKNTVLRPIPENQPKIVPIHILRFEKDLFTTNVDSLETGIKKLRSKYDEFYDMFNRILHLGSEENPKYTEELRGFITDYYQTLNYTKVLEVFPDVNWLANDFQKAFERYRDFFPDKRVPSIITYISGWNNMVVTSDTILAISLDMFMGRNSDFYSNLQLPQYQRYTMQKEYILPLSMEEWATTEFSFKDSASTLLSNMLYQGKIMYFLKNILPDANDTLIFGFRPDQVKWCRNNEKQMWTYLLEKKLLFSTNYQILLKMVGPAPFTVYFTNESPGRAVVWLGCNIVESYMKEHKDVTLAQLMHDSDYQKILRESNYKP